MLKRNLSERERGELSEAHRRWPAHRCPLIHEESVEHLPKGATAAEPVAINLVLLPLGRPRFNGN